MSILDLIPREALMLEGYIHVSDTDAVMQAAFGAVPDIIDKRLAVPDIARWLQVSTFRLHGYIDDCGKLGVKILDADGRLSIRQMMKMDWSRLTDQGRTPKRYTSHYQGTKRRKQTKKQNRL